MVVFIYMMDVILVTIFVLICLWQPLSESYLDGHFFYLSKKIASTIFAQGTPLLYSTCSSNNNVIMM